MFYGYVGKSRNTDHIYVITNGYDSPEQAEIERDKKVKALPRQVYLQNYFLSRGILKSKDIIKIPQGYWGTRV